MSENQETEFLLNNNGNSSSSSTTAATTTTNIRRGPLHLINSLTSPYEFEIEEKSENQLDPMVVVFPARKNAPGVVRPHQPRRLYWYWLIAATLLSACLLIVNHGRATKIFSAGVVQVPKHYPNSPNVWETNGDGSNNNNNNNNSKSSSPPVTIVRANDKLPSSITPGTPLHAAEALQCRAAVVSFVINATDQKDECEGLKKAFDKTCGGDTTQSRRYKGEGGDEAESAQQSSSSSSSSSLRHFGDGQQSNKFINRRKFISHSSHSKHRRHRRLSEKLQELQPSMRKWNLWLYETKHYFIHGFWRDWWFPIDKDFFFAEDEILRVWDDSETIVAHDLDSLLHLDLKHLWEEEAQLRQWRSRRRRRRRTRQLEEFTNNKSSTTFSDRNKPINLEIPTKRKHASEEVLDDIVMLHKGDNKLSNQTTSVIPEQPATRVNPNPAQAPLAPEDDDPPPTPLEARTCCTSILNVFQENCRSDEEEQFSNRRLLFIVFVMALCGMTKSLIRHYRILWLPEAAGCIVVGIFVGYLLVFFPHPSISFDGHWFLRIMVPPIIFEAALSIDKRSFHRHIVPILLYAVVGTLMAAFITAEILFRGTKMMAGWCTPIPYVEALAFGALISSIDPIAVLSVLNNMGLTDKDTIYVLIFGESLLNDGVAIVLFETLVHFLDDRLIIDKEAIVEAAVHFNIVALGSIMIGALAGYSSTVYFWLFRGCQTPLVEVLMFFCWALLPYYVSDGLGWSGIVSTVATGIVMDICVVGQRSESDEDDDHNSAASGITKFVPSGLPADLFQNIFSNPQAHLSAVARSHIHFVTGMIATTLETAIFAYLGLFLFSHRYHWNFFHALFSIVACCLSRAIMIPVLSFFNNLFTKFRRSASSCCGQGQNNNNSNIAGVEINHKMQFVLWFAGLRGAMSFALVESVPLYDSGSGVGTRLKPELKAMTSACILFTVFVLGGRTFYVMDSLGLSPGGTKFRRHEVESLLEQATPTKKRQPNSPEE